MLRIAFTLIITLLICFDANSQSLKLGTLDGQKINTPANTYREEQKYPCELSPIGRRILKPLVKDSMIHYENAYRGKESESKQVQDGVSVVKDSSGNTIVTRFHWHKNKLLKLSFIHTSAGNNCIYYLKLYSGSSVAMISFVIDGNGSVLSRNDKDPLTNEERLSAQREVNAWVTYFE